MVCWHYSDSLVLCDAHLMLASSVLMPVTRTRSGTSPLYDDYQERPYEAIIFTHGFLGSPYEMAHVCEVRRCELISP